MISEKEAKRIGERFLLRRYHRAEITFNSVTLTTKEGVALYILEGKIKMPYRNPLGWFVSSPEEDSLKVEVEASQGVLLNWELR